MKRILFFGLLLLTACSQTPVSVAPDISTQSLGTRSDDVVTSAVVDTELGAVFVIGETNGALSSAKPSSTDVFLKRYDRSGKVIWKRQLVTKGEDYADGVVTTGKEFVYAGYVVTTPEGETSGRLEQFRADGTPVWSRTFDVDTYYDGRGGLALSADASGNVYVTGSLGFAFELRKYSAAGSLLWTEYAEGGGIFFVPTGVGTDANGDVYVTANEVDDSYITPSILKYSPSGKQLFGKALVVKGDVELTGLQVQGNALYLAGTKHYNWVGDIDKKSDADGFVAKYSLSGERVWQQGFGTSTYDEVNSVSVDPSGSVYVTGFTYGALGGANQGNSDIFLRKLDGRGNTLWTKQIGSRGGDSGTAVAAYSSNELYLAGSVSGKLAGGTYHGGEDGFLRRTDGSGNRVWTDQ